MPADIVKKLSDIFFDINYEPPNQITLKKAEEFNSYVEANLSKETAIRDANEFIKSCALINGSSVK